MLPGLGLHGNCLVLCPWVLPLGTIQTPVSEAGEVAMPTTAVLPTLHRATTQQSVDVVFAAYLVAMLVSRARCRTEI